MVHESIVQRRATDDPDGISERLLKSIQESYCTVMVKFVELVIFAFEVSVPVTVKV
jgi:hypothetical protein